MRAALSGNYRTLLIELMLYGKNNTVYFIQDVQGNTIDKKLKKEGINCFCYFRDKNKNPIHNLISYYKQEIALKTFIKENNKRFVKFDEVVGSDHIFSLFTHFYDVNNIKVIEEGFANYTEKEQLYKECGRGTVKYVLYRIVLGQVNLLKYEPYGYDNKVSEVILTGIRKIPEQLKNKVKICSLNDLWENSDRTLINSVFSFNPELYKNKIIILTQPISEDGICTEEQKFDIYEKIISRYGKNNVVIKPHPRELSNYVDRFKECDVDLGVYPFELLLLNKVNIQQVVTITSTAAFDCIGLCDVSILGTKNYPELKNKLGLHDERFFRKGEKL